MCRRTPTDTVGIVTDEGPVLADTGPKPGQFVHPQPPALFVLHPPTENLSASADGNPAASGCVLLPGIPHLGLEHRAAWVEAESGRHHHQTRERKRRQPHERPGPRRARDPLRRLKPSTTSRGVTFTGCAAS